MQTVIIKEEDGALLINGTPLSYGQLSQLKRYFIKQEAEDYIAKRILIETEGTQEEKMMLYKTILENETLMNHIANEFCSWYSVVEQTNPVIEDTFVKAIHSLIDFDREMKNIKGE